MGVSMGPGLTALFPNFAVLQLGRPGSREGTHGGLRRRIYAEGGRAVVFATDELRMITPPSTISGSAFFTVNNRPFTLMSKSCRNAPGDSVERGEFGYSGIGEQDVDPAEFLFDLGVEPVEIGEFRHVALNPQSPMADFREAASSSALRRPVMTTRAPSAAKSFAVASQAPLPPVTIAIFRIACPCQSPS